MSLEDTTRQKSGQLELALAARVKPRELGEAAKC